MGWGRGEWGGGRVLKKILLITFTAIFCGSQVMFGLKKFSKKSLPASEKKFYQFGGHLDFV